MTVIATPAGIEAFRLLQFKYAIRLEQRGLRHSSGRSVLRHAALELGMKPRSKPAEVLARIEELLAAR